MVSKQLLRKPSVLVVDDKPANILALEVVLGDDHMVYSATSGREALAFLNKNCNVDVILLDVQMPDMDGFEVAGHIKKTAGCQDIPIVFVTAVYQEDPYVKMGYEAGGVDYFGKPFDPEILKLKIAIYASFRQKEDFLRERELHIRESEELLRVGRKLSAVLESLPVGVLIADMDSRICQITEEVAKILRSVEAAESDSYGEILRWWDASGQAIKAQNGPLSRALRGERSHSESIEIPCFDGSRRAVFVSAAPLRGLDAKILGAVVLIQDATETRKIENDLEERVAKLIGLGVELEGSAAR